MKQKLIILSAILGLMVFSNCQTEEMANEAYGTHNDISIARKKFKEFHKLPSLTEKALGRSNTLLRGNAAGPIYDFEIDSTSVTQMEKEGNIYYTMAIYRATATEESFENLVVSDDAQQAYIFKYYPSAEYLQNKTFMAHPQYSGGLRIIPINYSQIFNRQNCVGVTFSFCTNPGGGAAGPGCYDNVDGGAHVVTISYEVCSADDDFLNLTQIIADQAPGSSNGGGGAGGSGGGSLTPGSYPAGSPQTPIPSNPNSPLAPVTDPGGNPVLTEPVMLSNSIRLFVRDLDVLQKAWWNNPANAVAVGIITDYLEENTINGIVDIEAKEIFKEVINYLVENPQQEFTYENYPGKNNNMPFKWWENQYFLKENLVIFEQTPNGVELLLFYVFPDKALLHKNNSATALSKSTELVMNGTLTGITDGKADAFRHAYWNALDTAEIGFGLTKFFTDAHEVFSSGLPKQMDLYNNEKGREKAVTMNFNFFTSDSEIESSILIEVYIGHLVYISGGTLIPTN